MLGWIFISPLFFGDKGGEKIGAGKSVRLVNRFTRQFATKEREKGEQFGPKLIQID